MGTRADFYVGTGPSAEWLGSIAYDGYPDGNQLAGVVEAKSLDAFRAACETVLRGRDRLPTRPAEGWPWPWKDSRTTDYAYAWCSDGKVRLSSFGHRWQTPESYMRDGCGPDELTDDEVRDMSSIRADLETRLAKSGCVFLGVKL